LSSRGCGGVGGSFLSAYHNSLFWHVVSRASSWILVAITCICLSIGVMGGSVLVLSLLAPSITSTDLCIALLL
jgi:type IV secretory pathway TrbF-like protein